MSLTLITEYSASFLFVRFWYRQIGNFFLIKCGPNKSRHFIKFQISSPLQMSYFIILIHSQLIIIARQTFSQVWKWIPINLEFSSYSLDYKTFLSSMQRNSCWTSTPRDFNGVITDTPISFIGFSMCHLISVNYIEKQNSRGFLKRFSWKVAAPFHDAMEVAPITLNVDCKMALYRDRKDKGNSSNC